MTDHDGASAPLELQAARAHAAKRDRREQALNVFCNICGICGGVAFIVDVIIGFNDEKDAGRWEWLWWPAGIGALIWIGGLSALGALYRIDLERGSRAVGPERSQQTLSPVVLAAAPLDSTGSPQISQPSERRSRTLIWTAVAVVVGIGVGIFRFVYYASTAPDPSVWLLMLPIALLTTLVLCLGLPWLLVYIQLHRRMDAIESRRPGALLVPVYRTTVFVAEIRALRPEFIIQRSLVLSVDDTGVTVWSGGHPHPILVVGNGPNLQVSRVPIENEEYGYYGIAISYRTDTETIVFPLISRNSTSRLVFRTGSDTTDRWVKQINARLSASASGSA